MDKYDSTDYWYTFINSLPNEGLSFGKGDWELDDEIQEKLLSYLKEKIEDGITNGETALPPGIHNYFWRFPIEMLPKARELTDSFLESDPKNPGAVLLRTIVELADWDANNDPHIDGTMSLIPKDPCMNLVVISKYRSSHGHFGEFEGHEKCLRSLENLYTWAEKQNDTARYQEAKSFYRLHKITPYTVYKHLKNGLHELNQKLNDNASLEENTAEIEKYYTEIKKCRDLVPMEKAAFLNKFAQKSDVEQDLIDATSDNEDIWDVYLKSLVDHKNTPPRKLTQNDQDHLFDYLKTKIKAGVVDGKTTLPAHLQEHISNFPEAMHLELREFAENILESQHENGAAAKILAILVQKSEFPYLEQAIELLPNDAEICFISIKRYSESYSGYDNSIFELTLPTLKKMFERAQQQDEDELYLWLTKLYNEIGSTPCHIYRKLMTHPEGNAELIEMCNPLIIQTEQAFQQRLEEVPDDWYALRGLGDIYETLGETELAEKYHWEPHTEYKWHQKAWEGLQLPDYSVTTLNGTTVSFSDYLGKLVLLNYCAWWCGPCTGEIPYIKQVYEEHHQNGFETLRISIDEKEEDLRKYIEEHDIPGVQIFDNYTMTNGPAKYYGIYWVPSHWLIDRDGKILSVEIRQDPLVHRVNWIESTRVGEMVPDFSAVDIDGNHVSPATFRGKVVLLYFGYPEQVLTCVDTIYQKYHTKGFDIIGVSVCGWNKEEALRERVRDNNFLGKHIYDGGGWSGPLAKQFGIDLWRELPAIVLIDKDGKIITSRYGKVHSPETWAARLEKLVVTHLELT